MTREEAINLFEERAVRAGYTAARGQGPVMIDTYVALGILKLDEPKSAEERVAEIIRERIARDGGNFPSLAAEAILIRIDAAGLKIVEK